MVGVERDEIAGLPIRIIRVELQTVRALIDRGELPAEFSVPSPQPKSRRRGFRLRRQDVHDFIARSRVKPGELRRLYSATGGRELSTPG